MSDPIKCNLDLVSIVAALHGATANLRKGQIAALAEVIRDSHSGRIECYFGHEISWQNTTTYHDCEITISR